MTVYEALEADCLAGCHLLFLLSIVSTKTGQLVHKKSLKSSKGAGYVPQYHLETAEQENILPVEQLLPLVF